MAMISPKAFQVKAVNKQSICSRVISKQTFLCLCPRVASAATGQPAAEKFDQVAIVIGVQRPAWNMEGPGSQAVRGAGHSRIAINDGWVDFNPSIEIICYCLAPLSLGDMLLLRLIL